MKQDRQTDAGAAGQREQLVGETAKIRWQELQFHFARGVVVCVSIDMDLIDVACALSADDAALLEQWINDGKVTRQFDEQAAAWAETDASVWCVVVKPWVLVQPLADQRLLN